MARPAWAQAEAAVEWVRTTPPISEKRRYSTRWVGVSDDGLRSPSTTSPVSSRTTTMSCGVSSSYGTPLGLITMTPEARSTPLAFPNERVTSPARTSAWLACQTDSRRSVSDDEDTDVTSYGRAPSSSQPAGKVVVGLVPAQFLGEARYGRAGIDEQELAAGHLGEVRDQACTNGPAQNRVVRAAGHQPALGRGGEVRARLPDRSADGQASHRLLRRHEVYLGRDDAEPVAHVHERGHDGRTGARVEDEADRVVSAADRERVDLAADLRVGDRGANLEHVGPKHLGPGGAEMVGVVLHERSLAGETAGHDLDQAHHDRGLPIAFRTEAIAVGHQALDRDPRQLHEPVKVLEGIGERAEASGGHEFTQGDLDPGGLAQGLAIGATRPQGRRDVIGRLIEGDHAVNLRLGHTTHRVGQVAYAEAVDRDPELHLRRDLVALRHRHVAHVVAKPGELEVPGLAQPARRPRPGPDPVLNLHLLPVAGDGFAAQSQPRLDVRELSVTVGGLVQVHEVHVDLAPGEIAVELRVQVEERLRQNL